MIDLYVDENGLYAEPDFELKMLILPQDEELQIVMFVACEIKKNIVELVGEWKQRYREEFHYYVT